MRTSNQNTVVLSTVFLVELWKQSIIIFLENISQISFDDINKNWRHKRIVKIEETTCELTQGERESFSISVTKNLYTFYRNT